MKIFRFFEIRPLCPPWGEGHFDAAVSNYAENTMKQTISWMLLSVNLLKLGSSILPRAKQATSRNNVATEKRIPKKKFWRPIVPAPKCSASKCPAPKRTRPVFSLGASKTDQKRLFLQNRWILPTLETLGVKTVYFKELIMKFKVVHNVVSDNFYCNQNTVRWRH